ncbi:23S rRNA (adenine(1618)-N(6))-methyltransferase RlmF [Marinomonas mediterranea]|uniref:23S rRNA (adenine(1618)-N(6))-methyltransferase RlmF n=1 Tax=Marinomonas mediterranea TaxID=119864 RepID=UPI00234C0351|nr:23S rRNA (adenine(1618)-N(6))-methyltransferase RlmF [Marinomonas mediterranea]WCN11967.1 23S rRNA (adenine(1618)-N(6))-methyltransferase RlmF [Marinomonas mediterranea]
MKQKHSSKRTRESNTLGLHPRNPHRSRYDFALLVDSFPELAQYVFKNQYGSETIHFSDPDAVRALNSALLSHFYGISFWDIPKGFLCPPIPGRADYIHHLADLLAQSNNGTIPRGKRVKALDVGVGANCVYPIVGYKEYGWQFVGVDANSVAVMAASEIVKANGSLKKAIKIRQQPDNMHVFQNVWTEGERFDVTLCNPPFHTSEASMEKENTRKRNGLKARKSGQMDNQREHADTQAPLNFGGQSAELWCDGGEAGFISRMIQESVAVKDQCFWFTSLVSRQANLPALRALLKKVNVQQIKEVEMAQGQKVSRFIAWSFLESDQIDYWQANYWNS